MRHHTFLPLRFFAFILLLIAVQASPSRGQTGPGLLAKPWPDKDDVSEGQADAYFMDAGHVKGYDSPYRLDLYDSSARFRLLPGNEISPRVGYDFLFLDTHSNAPHLTRQLTDAAVGFGTGIAKWDTWVAGVSLGVGYAGDKPFGEGRGWYGKGDFIVADQINADDFLAFIIDYDGHRTFMPDVPIPGFGFSHRFDPTLQAVLGLPYDSLSWKPTDNWDIEAEYYIPTNLRISASYQFIPHFWAYGSFDNALDSFRVEQIKGDRRLLFSQRRVELGLRFTPIEQFTLKIAAGYAFEGGFRNGFDYRDSNSVVDFSDVPYVHAGVEWRF